MTRELMIRLNGAGEKGRVIVMENDGTGKFTIVANAANFYDLPVELKDVVRGYKDAITDDADTSAFKEGETLASTSGDVE